MSNFFNDIGKAAGKVWDSSVKEANRAVNEAGRHVAESFNDISKATDEGGFVGGAATAIDKLSPGNIAAGLVDSIIPGEDLPKPLAEGISGAVNLAVGGPVQILALVDFAQAFGALGSTPTASAGAAPRQGQGAQGGQRMQTPEAPSDAQTRRPPPAGPLLLGQPQVVGGATVIATGDQVMVQGTQENDTIKLSKNADGTVNLTINGETRRLTPQQAENIIIRSRGGDDQVEVGPGVNGVSINTGEGDDFVKVEANKTTVVTGNGNDRIVAYGSLNSIDSGKGYDRVDVRGGANRIAGGFGRDTITVTGNGNRIDGGLGNDRINVSGKGNRVSGGHGDDRINVRGDRNRIDGGAGNDRITVRGDRNQVSGDSVDVRGRDNQIGDKGDGTVRLPRDLRGIVTERPDGGYSPPPLDGGGFVSDDFMDIEIGTGKLRLPKPEKMSKAEKDLQEANAEIDKILSNPNLSFEDLVFLLMRALIKQSQAEVKIGLDDERAANKAAKKGRDASRAEIKGLQAGIDEDAIKVAGMKEGPEKQEAIAKLNQRRSELDGKKEELSTSLNDAAESRQERVEELKNALNKITEMQQALSNILNSLHQTAMNTIGNIR